MSYRWSTSSTLIMWTLSDSLPHQTSVLLEQCPHTRAVSGCGHVLMICFTLCPYAAFTLDLHCGAGAQGEGSVTFDLYLMDNSTTVREVFVITKDCGGVCVCVCVCVCVRVSVHKHVLQHLHRCICSNGCSKLTLLTLLLSTIQCISTCSSVSHITLSTRLSGWVVL